MGTIKTFRDLIVWQKFVDLVTQIYPASGNFPKSDFYGLISQLRRSAV
ncbi:MAG: four helix bundle protein [SAR324 cluster bacterium]|nr:four helix bundle protein [SAR324 cluster bacterium]